MTSQLRIGTVGLGLMGSSIATCILAAGHAVTSLIKEIDTADEARERILGFLHQLEHEGLLTDAPETILARLTITDCTSSTESGQMRVKRDETVLTALYSLKNMTFPSFEHR
ncbi:hypothetical protein GCM10028818_52790 [Spirosoma horti]